MGYFAYIVSPHEPNVISNMNLLNEDKLCRFYALSYLVKLHTVTLLITINMN